MGTSLPRRSVNQKEIDIAIAELEVRLERLRVLYEQYFMGLERTMPSVAHKDVERRVQELRKARFQNTAKRFKFQTLSQRYNTMQQHWTRVCREIEEGRYRRHRLKAERTIGVMEKLRQQNEAEEEAAQHQAANATEMAEEDLAALMDAGSDDDLEAAFQQALRAAEDPRASPSPLKKLRADGGDTAVSRPSAGAEERASGLLGKLAKHQTDPAIKARPQTSISPNLARSRPPAARPAFSPREPREEASPREKGPTPPPAQANGPARPAGDPKPAPQRARPQPERPKPPAEKAKPRAGGGSSHLSDARLKELHQRYLDARKKTNKSAVSYEKLERSIRDTEKKLRAKHKGRNVDFDVVVKDGKAIIKPKLG